MDEAKEVDVEITNECLEVQKMMRVLSFYTGNLYLQ